MYYLTFLYKHIFIQHRQLLLFNIYVHAEAPTRENKLDQKPQLTANVNENP